MAFKVLWLACFAVPSVVTSSVVPGHHEKLPLPQEHAVETLTFPLLKRQELPARNETTIAASTTETRRQSTVSITYSSTIEQVQRTSDSLKDSVSATATTSRLVQSSSYNSAIQQSESINQPQLATPTSTQPPLNSAHETYSSRPGSSTSSPSTSQHYVSSHRLDSAVTSIIISTQVSTRGKIQVVPSVGIPSTQAIPISHGASTRTTAQASPPQITDHSSVLHVSSTTLAEKQSAPITSELGSKIESHVTIPAASSTSPQAIPPAESRPLSSATRLGPGSLQHITETTSIAQSYMTSGIPQAISVSVLTSVASSAPSTNGFTTGPSLGVDIVPSAIFSAVSPSDRASSTQVGLSGIQHSSYSATSSTSTAVLPSQAVGSVSLVDSVVSSSMSLKSSAPSNSVPTSESMSDAPRVALSSSTLILSSTTLSGLTYSGASGTGALNTQSSNVLAQSTMSTMPPLSATVSSMSNPTSMPATNTSIASVLESSASSGHASIFTTPQSSLGLNSQLSASATLLTNATVMFATVGSSSTARTTSVDSLIGHEAGNKTSSLDAARSETSVNSGIRPSGFVIGSSISGLHAPQTPSAPVWANATVFASAPAASASSDSTALINDPAASASQVSITGYSTSSERKWATNTIAVSTASTATSSATASPPVGSPLTSSQTVGVAIAGTTGILIAIVAAIFLARRYRAKRSRRSSTGSVYPKVAYLYDPPGRGTDGTADPEEPLMSGGASGMPLGARNILGRPVSSDYDHRHSAGTLPVRFSDPGNPFRDPGNTLRYSNDFDGRSIYASAGAVAAVSAAMRGYKATPQRAPTMTERSLAEHTDWHSPTPGPGITGLARSPSRRSILSEITSMAYSPMSRSESGASRRQPPSPYGLRANRSLPCVRETTDTDSYRDPFEHDLLLQVDTRTETPDCVTIYAPSTAPTKPLSNNPWAASMVGSQVQHMSYKPSPVSPDATLMGSGRFSPTRDGQTATTYTTNSQKQEDSVVFPISPPLGTTHRGWDDIRRYSDEKVIPSLPSFSPPTGHLSSFAVKQKSLPQLRCTEYSLDASSSRIRLPLTLKIPGSTGNLPATNTDGVKSPETAFSQSVHSLASLLQKNKSRNLEYSCAGVK